jgi:hypothetical protein
LHIPRVCRVVGPHLPLLLDHLSPPFICCFRLDRRHPKDVFDVFWPRLAGLFARCHGHTTDGEAVNVFTEVVPRARHRTLTVPPSAPESALSSSPSLLERRLAGRPDLDIGALRHLRDSLTLAIPSQQVSDPGSFSFPSLLGVSKQIQNFAAKQLKWFRVTTGKNG